MESDSENEHYDQWPGCTMGETGCHYGSYFTTKYFINEKFSTFFKLENNCQLTKGEIEYIIIDYSKKKNNINNTIIKYDKELWDLLELDISIYKQLKYYKLSSLMNKIIL